MFRSRYIVLGLYTLHYIHGQYSNIVSRVKTGSHTFGGLGVGGVVYLMFGV